MLNKFLHLPLASKIALLSAGACLLCCLLLVFASHQGNRQLIRHSTELFGESQVQQLSRDASNPLVKGDKLSLQSLLNKLVESPMVNHGAIYDVDSRTVAAAGMAGSGPSFSAAITFQDSIAGYAVIIFDPFAQQQQASRLTWKLIALAATLAGIVFLAGLIPARLVSATLSDLSQIARTPLSRRSANTQVAYRGEDELKQLARDIVTGQSQQTSAQPAMKLSSNSTAAILLLEIIGQPESTAPTPTDAIGKLLQQIKTVCSLYKGEVTACRSNCLGIYFYFEDDEKSYPFRALCCAFLLRQWLQLQPPAAPIRMTLLLQTDCKNNIGNALLHQQEVDQSLQLVATTNQQLVTTADFFQHPSIEPRVEVTAINKQFFTIDQLRQPYRELLEQQLATLNRRAEHG